MSYSDAGSDKAQLILKAIKGVTDFAGRSRREELVYYWLACSILGVLINFSVSFRVSFETSILISEAFFLAGTIPAFALFVRRIHDQGRSGWWGLLLPLSLFLKIPRFAAEYRGDIEIILSQNRSPLGIAAGICSLAIIVLCLMPGTNGANRYGPDPRA